MTIDTERLANQAKTDQLCGRKQGEPDAVFAARLERENQDKTDRAVSDAQRATALVSA